jgi:choline dehydrogenase-like flavoprotein
MFHPFGVVAGVFDERVDGHKGPVGCLITSQEFYETDTSRGFVRGVTLECARGTGPMSAAINGLTEQPPLWGQVHRQVFDMMNGFTAGIGIITEDLPEEHNTVTLDERLTDAHGIPAPKITYTQAENNKQQIEFATARAQEVLAASGATMSVPLGLVRQTGWHLMGTARMGDDPKRSVINGWGRSHDVRNLFVVDGSLFVTSAAVNPTSTIQALALYVGDQIKRRITNLFD